MKTLAEKAEALQSDTAEANMRKQLGLWHTQGFVRDNWEITHYNGNPRATFHLVGCQPKRFMQDAAFRAYAEGFNDRRRAIMNRVPQN